MFNRFSINFVKIKVIFKDYEDSIDNIRSYF